MRGLRLHEDAPIEEIRGATRRATTALVQLALEEHIDFVVIAGDVFDGDWEDIGTGLFFNREMSRLHEAGIQVYLIRGNHDAKSVITRTLAYPPNVHEFSTSKAQTFFHEDIEVALHGRGFPARQLNENIVPDYPSAEPGKFNIGLLHTSLSGSVEHDTYAPCSMDELQRAGYDYWALGHIHQPAVLCEEPWIVYSGNTQGRHIKETGERGCYLVTVAASGQSSVEFRSLDSVRWYVLEIDITGVFSFAELLEKVDSAIEQALTTTPLAVLRLVLAGSNTLASQLELERDQLASECLSIAQRYNGGRVWIESLRLRVSGKIDLPYELNQHDDFGSDVMSALQPARLADTFARDTWGPEIDKVLRDLSPQQRAEIEALLPTEPDSPASVDSKSAGLSDDQVLQQSLDLEPGELPGVSAVAIHPFLNEIRNLTLSALDWSDSENTAEAADEQVKTRKINVERDA